MKHLKNLDPISWSIGILIILWGVFLVLQDTEDTRWDYKINLDHNNIEIERLEEGDVITIHADSLDAFITQDNL